MRRKPWTRTWLVWGWCLVLGCSNSPPVTEPIASEQPASSAPKTKPNEAPQSVALAQSGDNQPIELPARPQPVSEPVAATPLPSADASPEYRRVPHRKRPLDIAALKELGIEVVETEGQVFRFVTDLPAETRRPLEPLVDALLPELAAYFGPLPPARDKSDFHMTGFLMSNREPFIKAGALPEELAVAFHGKQIAAEFWMNNQAFDYYRAHLLLHEATHVFMRHLPEQGDLLPVWYLEGMAEFFATHERAADGKVRFAVMPQDRSKFAGWERITVVQRDVARRGVRSIRDVMKLDNNDFRNIESYGWAWALCRFFDAHPLSQETFRSVAASLSRELVADLNDRLLKNHPDELEAEWMQFAANIELGFDFERAAIVFAEGKPLIGQARSAEVLPNRGWQSSGFAVEADKKYRIEVSGQITLANQSKPFGSEANGVTIRYVRGQPIGRLLACIRGAHGEPGARSMLDVTPLGSRVDYTAKSTGTLYLRVNDSLAELADNQGQFVVTMRELE